MRRLATLPLVLLALPPGGIFTLAGGGPSAPRDGEPAALAGLPRHAPVAALPDGSFLVGDETSVWRVDRQGVIRPVAGGGESGDDGDGGPALEAHFEADALAALPGGGFAIVDYDSLRLVGPDGRLRTLRIPHTVVDYVAAASDGSLLAASFGRVLRIAPDGAVTVAAHAPAGDDIRVAQIAATPDGGFVFSDAHTDDDLAGRVRVWRVAPDGAMRVIAGGGPFAPTAAGGLQDDADGQPAVRAQLASPAGVAVTPDGGVLLSEDSGRDDSLTGVVRYLAPDVPQLLGVALVRDRDRVFGRGRPNAVHVALTRPATVTLTVAGLSTTQALDAGVSRVPLPAGLRAHPHTVTLSAADAAGQRAYDRTRIFPPRWLPEETARLVAFASGLGDTVAWCRRLGSRRIDCEVFQDVACDAVASVSLVHDRLRWGTYACRGGVPFHRRPRYSRPPRRLRPADWRQCPGDCPPALFGRVDESALIPSD